MYDCTDYALNLFNVPTVAYSGTADIQKQAADIMAKALEKEGIRLRHVLGPKTGHSYHPEAKREVNRRIDALAARGRDAMPVRVNFTTRTLRYNRCHWVVLEGLEKHWKPARVRAEIFEGNDVDLRTENVSAVTLSIGPGLSPFDLNERPTVTIDDAEVEAPPVFSDRSWSARYRKSAKGWVPAPEDESSSLHKRPGLQGPIDDAFMDSFLMVRPTGSARNHAGDWARSEMTRAIAHWRKQFRGEARVKDDKDVTDADIAEHNLVLWGDPGSNALLGKIAEKLPILWTGKSVRVGGTDYDAAKHALVLIYPNPLNPRKYVVLNSGFTFRDFDYLNNARQVPKLPDWAVIDLSTPPNSRWPGKIADAGFFDEEWRLQSARE